MRKVLWLLVSGLMGLSLVMAACGPTAAPTTPSTPTTPTTPITPATPITPTAPTTPTEVVKPAPEMPKYGGTLRLPVNTDIAEWDVAISQTPTASNAITNQGLWSGDWAKGPAGGYGTNQTDFAVNNIDVFGLKTGLIAETTKWTADVANSQGTIVYQIRRGIHWGLNPASEASRLVGGREVTADDVVAHLRRTITDPKSYFYRSTPALRTANITKTGPWEVTVKISLVNLMTAVSRFGNSTMIQPPEVVAKYGDMSSWKNSVGTGSFILIDFIPGSQAVLDRNPNYWMTDPIGPGKGNQLPYVDRVQYLIIPDASTRMAAMRTGKIDQIPNINMDDAATMRKTVPALKELLLSGSRLGAVGMRTDKVPFNDVRVRQAMMMSLDFNAINQSLYGGKGQIVTWPISYFKEYAGLYVAQDAPDFPEAAKALYTYNPDKAKQLLTEAGYPNGFKTSLLLTAPDVDYFSIWKDMWAKVSIDLKLDVRESGVVESVRVARQQEGLVIGGNADAAIWLTSSFIQGISQSNISLLDDPVINKALDDVRLAAVTVGETEAMRLYREMVKYMLPLAYAIPRHKVPASHFWWPWIKNYSGEMYVGYADANWPQRVWIDQDLKKSMGY